MAKFETPSPEYNRQNKFGKREVGLTHPDWPSFFRLRDNGDVEIVAGEGCGIYFSPRTNTITINADTIKFYTKKDGGLRWNRLVFNSNATTFNEPAFLNYDDEYVNNIYKDVEHF